MAGNKVGMHDEGCVAGDAHLGPCVVVISEMELLPPSEKARRASNMGHWKARAEKAEAALAAAEEAILFVDHGVFGDGLALQVKDQRDAALARIAALEGVLDKAHGMAETIGSGVYKTLEAHRQAARTLAAAVAHARRVVDSGDCKAVVSALKSPRTK